MSLEKYTIVCFSAELLLEAQMAALNLPAWQ
jgi:hypothetical protein